MVFEKKNFCLEDYTKGILRVNEKRPYGNSNIFEDINSILKLNSKRDDLGELTSRSKDNLIKWNYETIKLLKIILITGSFKLGLYSSNNGIEWKLIKKDIFKNELKSF